MSTLKLQITGMKCQHCVQNVTQALNKLDGVHATVSLEQAAATVESDKPLDAQTVIKAIQAAGYQAKVQE
jgi:Cu+-exporting ATPase